MGQKYKVKVGDKVVPHIEGKRCKCSRLLPLSHEGPCPSCGGTDFEEMVIPNLSDLRTAKPAPPEKEIPMGGTD